MFSDHIWILDCSALVRSLNVDKLLSEYLWSSDLHYRWDALLVSGYLWYFNAYSLHVGFSAAVSIIRFDTDLSFIASSLQIIIPNCWFEAAWILEMDFFYTCTYNFERWGRYLASNLFPESSNFQSIIFYNMPQSIETFLSYMLWKKILSTLRFWYTDKKLRIIIIIIIYNFTYNWSNLDSTSLIYKVKLPKIGLRPHLYKYLDPHIWLHMVNS